MVSPLADVSRSSEASQIGSRRTEVAPPERSKVRPTLNDPSYKYGNQISRIVGTFGKRPIIVPTKN